MKDEIGHEKWPHQPVLYHEIINALRPRGGGLYVDCTLGAGGIAQGLLEASSPDGRLLGLDLDPEALELSRKRLAPFKARVTLVKASFVTLMDQLKVMGWDTVDGIVLDLGVSSMQLDSPTRGFSFRVDAPLDMRFDPHQTLTAASLVNELPEAELADVLWRYGEERRSRQVAKAIVQARPIKTTQQLSEVVVKVTRGGRKGIHPATRTFQALRIAVNREPESLKEVLPQAVATLVPGGRLAVISFHSLEDRLVKAFFRQESRDCVCPPEQVICTCKHRAVISMITRHVIKPTAEEVKRNPRSRSARLRVVERLP
ncbi:MAG: 16S rRNA (cytosine(1402)-N(4))-methyltransferase RsmH [Chloroflexota bacterium]